MASLGSGLAGQWSRWAVVSLDGGLAGRARQSMAQPADGVSDSWSYRNETAMFVP